MDFLGGLASGAGNNPAAGTMFVSTAVDQRFNATHAGGGVRVAAWNATTDRVLVDVPSPLGDAYFFGNFVQVGRSRPLCLPRSFSL